VVKKIRNVTKHKKVGHGGTLDPFATGVLIIGTEKDTKQLSSITNFDKEYIAELKLGEATNTLDTEGELVEESPVPTIDEGLLNNVLKSFLGKQKQIPPMFSAKKKNGTRLYKLARKNIEVEREKNDIMINSIYINDFSEDKINFSVNCSKGTYIRVLGADIAKKIGTVGYLVNLRRTKVGDFDVTESLTLEKFISSWKSITV
ncbi:tRNA pseudouridine(55) synthase TruB, partial [bacterium]|nr:tRNA pseudouridine(55) synthase TruB [bacterium]